MIGRCRFARCIQAAVAFLALTALPIRVATAQQGTQPLAPDDAYYGMKLPEWAAAWVQWWVSIPKAANPHTELDTTGVRAGVGQRSPVWFLPPVPFAPNRVYVIPEGQSILVGFVLEDRSALPGTQTDASLLSFRSRFVDSITALEVSLDGVPIPGFRNRYRVQTPVFSVTLPPGNVWDVSLASGKKARQVAVTDGYFALFPPLPVGDHVLAGKLELPDPATGKPLVIQGTTTLRIQRANEASP